MADNIMFIPFCILMAAEAAAVVIMVRTWVKACREAKEREENDEG